MGKFAQLDMPSCPVAQKLEAMAFNPVVKPGEISHAQILMLEKLQMRKTKLDKKLKYMMYIHAWRKLSTIIFVAAFAAVLICSLMAAAMAAPPVAAALAAATSIPLGSMGKWIDSLLQSYENAVKGQKEIMSSIQDRKLVCVQHMPKLGKLLRECMKCPKSP
ncbi:UPF0496 protein At4g34320-like isoform X1 [Coffea arabica]|uniref:UPF0496 protein At4g34320-like n=1 Tax=Coffea arabica TaxID=13443 RepID=A0A6P6U2F7_COFAR|nr:UPF0496 protein At4g34320-like [Coffea arabica]XP_027084859.1 UPF0496 protein At4g34320-like [Coffea arabica]XP_027084869.1 UPF0496 protein At4g34320-like [Coffea arabica]